MITSVAKKFFKPKCQYRIAGKFGELSMIHQTKTIQIFTYNYYLMAESIHSPNFSSPNAHNSEFAKLPSCHLNVDKHSRPYMIGFGKTCIVHTSVFIKFVGNLKLVSCAQIKSLGNYKIICTEHVLINNVTRFD